MVVAFHNKSFEPPCVLGYFNTRAKAFSAGDVETWCAAFDIPMQIPVADRNLFIRTYEELLKTTRIYRENLLVQSYDRTECTVLHKADIAENRAQVLANWAHYNKSGALISETHGNHICRLTPAGSWIDQTIELIDDPKERIISGMPIV